jgi:hypothetical protein
MSKKPGQDQDCRTPRCWRRKACCTCVPAHWAPAGRNWGDHTSAPYDRAGNTMVVKKSQLHRRTQQPQLCTAVLLPPPRLLRQPVGTRAQLRHPAPRFSVLLYSGKGIPNNADGHNRAMHERHMDRQLPMGVALRVLPAPVRAHKQAPGGRPEWPSLRGREIALGSAVMEGTRRGRGRGRSSIALTAAHKLGKAGGPTNR